MELSEKDLAYVGGIMDGEGSISICKLKTKDTRRGFGYFLQVSVGNTNESLIDWLRINFGGSKYFSKGSIRRGNKALWKWALSAHKALVFLQIIKPYLRIKSFQAEVGIAFQEAKWQGRHITKQHWAVEETQRILMRQLNGNQKKASG